MNDINKIMDGEMPPEPAPMEIPKRPDDQRKAAGMSPDEYHLIYHFADDIDPRHAEPMYGYANVIDMLINVQRVANALQHGAGDVMQVEIFTNRQHWTPALSIDDAIKHLDDINNAQPVTL